MILDRQFVAKPWGRTDLPTELGGDGGRIGEILYDRADEPLPVLVKWIFTSECLSIQVHPCDDHARARGLSGGKEEYWIVTQAEPGAVLGIGTKRELTDEDLRSAALDGTIGDLIDWKPVKPGDWYCIPPGTVHAIGAGVTLVEVQPNIDASYRLFDHGRSRELHIDDAVSVARTSAYCGEHGKLGTKGPKELISTGPSFSIYACRGGLQEASLDEPFLLVPIAGTLRAGGHKFATGDVGYFTEATQIHCEDSDRYLVIEVAERE